MSSSITLSQVDLGRPGGLRQSGGGRSAAAMTRWWSSSGADRARCPKNLNRNDLTFSETGKQPVMLLTVLFAVCLVYGIRKIFRRHQIIVLKTPQYAPSDFIRGSTISRGRDPRQIQQRSVRHSGRPRQSTKSLYEPCPKGLEATP